MTGARVAAGPPPTPSPSCTPDAGTVTGHMRCPGDRTQEPARRLCPAADAVLRTGCRYRTGSGTPDRCRYTGQVQVHRVMYKYIEDGTPGQALAQSPATCDTLGTGHIAPFAVARL